MVTSSNSGLRGVATTLADVTLIAATLDPDGRRVTLTERTWKHIKEEHPELAPHLREIMAAVREPDVRLAGRRAGEEWCVRKPLGHGLWLRVVVHYEGDEGWIATSHHQRSLPDA